jgi:GGDEF domain-containing protein
VRDLPDRSPPGGSAVERLARAARAAQQLCDVLWEALHVELLHPRGERVAELSERLSEISSTVAMLASDAPSGLESGPAPAPTSAPPREVKDPGAIDRPWPPATQAAEPPSAAPAPTTSPTPVPSAAASEVPAFERRTPPPPSTPPPPPAALQSIPTRAGKYMFTKLVDEQENGSPAEPLASVEPIQPEIEIKDVRREEGPSAWVSSVGRLLSRHAEDGLPFAVLLVEIVDVARLERSETPHDLHGLVAKVESALGRGMRATDSLSRETIGRYWLVAPETNGTGARMLAERLARLVRTSASHRGVPMEVAIGIAVCPDDGTEAPALAARADLGVYSARATGRSISHTDPPSAG